MTERMIELYKEACEFAYSVCKEEGRPGGPSDHIWHTLSTGRFAELIVQRTLDIVEAHTEIFQSDQARAMVEHIKHSVKTDFGVEDV